jgi:hypothetical protein
MNAILKVKPGPEATSVEHGIMAYDRVTDDLLAELDIPLFLDTLALKIARVPAEDTHGALSYPLDAKQVDTFRFLLGLQPGLDSQEYYLEAVSGSKLAASQSKLEAIAALAAVSSKVNRWQTRRISEGELVVPTLRVLEGKNGEWMRTAELIPWLVEMFAPSGADALIMEGRSDTYFSQKVQNMISHRHQPGSFINQELAEYNSSRRSLRITDTGRSLVRALRE